MERIKKLLDKCKNFYEWLQEHPLNTLIALLWLNVTMGVVIFVTPIIWWIFTAAVILWAFSDDIKAHYRKIFGKSILQNLEDGGICFQTTKFMYNAICVDKPLDEVARTPSSVNSIYDNSDYSELYNGVTMLKLRVIRKNRDKEPDCEYLKIVLQDSVNARLADGYLRGYPWAISANSTVPLIKVATFAYSNLYIHIGILLTNSQVCVNAAQISDTPTLPKVADDTDPLFMKGEEKERDD